MIIVNTSFNFLKFKNLTILKKKQTKKINFVKKKKSYRVKKDQAKFLTLQQSKPSLNLKKLKEYKKYIKRRISLNLNLKSLKWNRRRKLQKIARLQSSRYFHLFIGFKKMYRRARRRHAIKKKVYKIVFSVARIKRRLSKGFKTFSKKRSRVKPIFRGLTISSSYRDSFVLKTFNNSFNLFFKDKHYLNFYSFQGRISYVKELKIIPYVLFFSLASLWIQLRDLFIIYELLFTLRLKRDYDSFFLNSQSLSFFNSLLLYEKLNNYLIVPQITKSFLNFSECILKIRLTTSNFFFTALDAVTYKTLLTGTGGMFHLPITKQPKKVLRHFSMIKKKLVKRQDIKHKRAIKNITKNSTQPRSKKFARKTSQVAIPKKKRPKWIQKTSFVSLFYLCDKFFNALKDFGYLQLRFWLLGYKVYNIFFKRKIIPRWRKQYSKLLLLSPYIIFQPNRTHNGMRLKKARRV